MTCSVLNENFVETLDILSDVYRLCSRHSSKLDQTFCIIFPVFFIDFYRTLCPTLKGETSDMVFKMSDKKRAF